jgi:tight adherence protein C
MKISILIPSLFAAVGAISLALNNSPHNEVKSRVGRSRDRKKVQERLTEIGLTKSADFESFRIRQLVIAGSASLTTIFILFIFGKPPVFTLLLSATTAVFVYFAIDRNLSLKVKNQRLLVDAEFPAIVEMYSLAMSAGETPLAAMERIAGSAKGSLAINFARVVDLVKSGKPFHLALDEMSRELDSILIRRFVDALIIATLRGAPLIDVLQRHAQEARESQRNRVLGAAAKAEISMMVPVVFLILPISILFALWPSLANLNSFTGA